jgi:trans-2,3-dihydro-3-hydroxyanthranilate isomerase
MKYTFHIVDVFSSTPFGGNQLAVLPEAAGISTEGMQKIAREFNFGETTFVLPKKDPANTCRVRVQPSSGRRHQSPILAGRPIAFRSSKVSRWDAEAKSKRRRVRTEAS